LKVSGKANTIKRVEGSKRLRKIGIVALARKLLIALWRYLAYGEMPASTG